MSTSATSPRPARVTRIQVEYDDGSCDTAELGQVSPIVLYGLTRKRPDSVSPRGAYTHGAIAALLFKTVVTTQWTDYASADREMTGLLRYWFGESR
jgi:hypothetical protein